jgi:subtilisin family serine protease
MSRTQTLAALFIPLILAGAVQAQRAPEAERSPGIILVKFAPEALTNIEQEIVLGNILAPEVAQVLERYGFSRGSKMFRDFMPSDTLGTSINGDEVLLVDISRWYSLEVSPTTDVVTLAAQLSHLPFIIAATPDYVLPHDSVFPNDPYFQWGYQWGLYNHSQPGRDIHAPQAWVINTGRSDVIAAIIDSGVDYNHPDLDPGNRSRVIQGYDFADNNADPMDDAPAGGHGTAVAGALGAITNNGDKTAGVMWNVTIMPLKAGKSSDTQGQVLSSAAGQAANYARQNGAHLINMSFSSAVCTNMWCEFLGDPLGEPLLNAYRQGLLIAGSAGNTGVEERRYPSGWDIVMAVGQSNHNDDRASLSTYGTHLDFVAPGGFYSTARYNSVASFGGTSHATPIALGVAGLVLSESRDRGFNLTNDDIRQIMRRTADDVNAATQPGFDKFIGHGRINAAAALAMISPPNTVTHLTRSSGSSTLTWDSHSHTFINGAYGAGGWLASGSYHGVKQYRVSGHVAFPIPYRQPPAVWIRERQTTGWAPSNPNSQSPFVNITNV